MGILGGKDGYFRGKRWVFKTCKKTVISLEIPTVTENSQKTYMYYM